MNSMGQILKLSIFGESHGAAVGFILDGVPAGIAIQEQDFDVDLARRKANNQAGATSRIENDKPQILSGIYNGFCTGSPICIIFNNENTQASDYLPYTDTPRPGHADYVAAIKYGGYADLRGGGHFSGRLGICITAAGVLAKKIIPHVNFITKVLRTEAEINEARNLGDSIGAAVNLQAIGMKAGRGEPFFGSIESLVSAAMFAVPGVRAVEFGDGVNAANMLGSTHNDPIINELGHTKKNGAGGINGGITNGNDIVVTVSMKPSSSIARKQQTWNFAKAKLDEISIKGRHDACIAVRGAVVLEAMLAIVLADAELMFKARCS